jgi:hypothetical protein
MKYPVEIAQETSLAGDGEKDRVVAGRKNGGAMGCGKAAAATGDELKPDISFVMKRGHF